MGYVNVQTGKESGWRLVGCLEIIQCVLEVYAAAFSVRPMNTASQFPAVFDKHPISFGLPV